MVWLWYEVTHKITDFFTSSHNEDGNRMNQIKETHKLTWKYCERIWSSPFNGVVHTRRAWNKCTHTHTDHSSTAYSDHSAGSANCALWLRLDGQLTNSVLRNRSNRSNNWTVTVPGSMLKAIRMIFKKLVFWNVLYTYSTNLISVSFKNKINKRIFLKQVFVFIHNVPKRIK